jgi:hypothetical protein
MKIRGVLFVLVALPLTAAWTNVRAEDFGSGSMMLADSAASGASPAANGCCDGDPGKCCDCCGPGTNPWDGTVKVGFGLRMSDNYVSVQNPVPVAGGTPTFASNDYNFFNPDDARIYLSGSAFGGLVKGTLDTALAGGGDFIAPNNVTGVYLLDGIAQFEFNDRVNFWMGRFLPPTDRANLNGPFYQTPWDYPFVSNYPSLLDGRDDGAAYWGQAGGGRLKWQMGLFNGIRYYAGGDPINPNADGNYLAIGRITVNLLDPEPGYYTQSCYFGDKEILAIGVTGAFQRDAGGTTAAAGDFCAGSVDLLWEHRLGNCGVLDVESAVYHYNYGVTGAEANTAAATAAAGGTPDPAAVFGLENQGNSEYVQVSYMLPQDICFGRMSGRLQPFGRYQYYGRNYRADAAEFSSVAGPLFYEGVDFGVNYVISGYNAKTTVAWEQRNAEGGITYDLLRMGVQLQY